MGEFITPVSTGDQLAIAGAYVEQTGQEYEETTYAEGRPYNPSRNGLNVKGVQMAQELGLAVGRFDVPDELVSWEVEYPTYNPLFVDMARGNTPFRKEQDRPDPSDPREVGEFNSLATSQVQIDADGYPLHPMGRTGLRGRFMLDRWGENPAADAIVTRINPDNGDWEVLLVQRGDTGEWALPGGRVDKGETAAQTAARELREEAGIEVDFSDAPEIYSGCARDSRDTDNAWMATTALHRHLSKEKAMAVQAQAGDDAVAAQWVRMERALAPDAHLFSVHGECLALVAQSSSATTTEVSTVSPEGEVLSPEHPGTAVPGDPHMFLGAVSVARTVSGKEDI